MSVDRGEAEANARAAGEGPAEPTPVVFIIGAGVLGTALASRLTRAGVPVAGLHGRRSELSDAARAKSGVIGTSGELPAILAESEVIIFSVRDQRIPVLARQLADEGRLRKGQILLHTSGAHPAADVLGPARRHVRGVGTFHPLLSFADPERAVDGMRNAAFGIEGDEPARRAALQLVRILGGRPVLLNAETMPLYHAGAVLASGSVVVLVNIARRLLVSSGVPPVEALRALLPLLRSTVENLDASGPPEALTGPIVRGDVRTVEQHIASLSRLDPGVLEIYLRLGREALRLARGRAGFDKSAGAAIERLLAAGADAPAAATVPVGGAAPAGTSARAGRRRGRSRPS